MLMMIAALIFLAASTPPSRAAVECHRWFPVWQACETLPDSKPRTAPLTVPSRPSPPSPPADGDDGPGKSHGHGGGHGHGHGKR